MNLRSLGLPDSFPPKTVIWPGSLLGSIAHAIFVARAPFMAHEQSWDLLNYNVQNSEGSRGTIAFEESKENFVGVFFLQTSKRNPLNQGFSGDDQVMALLRDLPDQLKPLAQKALQYVLQDINGEARPIITAAFWSDLNGPHIQSQDSWHDLVENGAILVKNQLLPIEVAIDEWVIEFEFSRAETDLTMSLFRQRFENPTEVITVTHRDEQQLRALAGDDAGLEACRESLHEVGIVVP